MWIVIATVCVCLFVAWLFTVGLRRGYSQGVKDGVYSGYNQAITDALTVLNKNTKANAAPTAAGKKTN